MDRENQINAIIELTKNTAEDITHITKQLYYMRKKPRICRKKPYKKSNYNLLKIQLSFTGMMAAARLAAIISQPIPRFPKGGNINSAVISEPTPEVEFIKKHFKHD